MIIRHFCVFLLVLFGTSLQAQSTWGTLSLIRYDLSVDEYGLSVHKPTHFTKMIEDLDGKEIELAGFIVPLEGKKKQRHLYFSAYPYASCFFCGNAGPETVIEVFMGGENYLEYTDKQIRISGTFRFVPGDFSSVMYQLENAKIIE